MFFRNQNTYNWIWVILPKSNRGILCSGLAIAFRGNWTTLYVLCLMPHQCLICEME